MMSGPMMMMDRKRMVVVMAVALGLFLLFVGAVLVDMSNARPPPGEVPGSDADVARDNLGLVWGPAVSHAGMFFFVLGLIAAAVLLEDMDIFVRLFLVILAFVAILLVLASSSTVFGVP